LTHPVYLQQEYSGVDCYEQLRQSSRRSSYRGLSDNDDSYECVYDDDGDYELPDDENTEAISDQYTHELQSADGDSSLERLRLENQALQRENHSLRQQLYPGSEVIGPKMFKINTVQVTL